MQPSALNSFWFLHARLVAQSGPTLCDPMDYSLPDSSVHEIFQARAVEWVAFFLLQGLFPTQRSNLRLLCLLHCRRILYPLSQPSLWFSIIVSWFCQLFLRIQHSPHLVFNLCVNAVDLPDLFFLRHLLIFWLCVSLRAFRLCSLRLLC